MPRLAWFTPTPPGRSGIAAYNAELLPLLADDFAIDVFDDIRLGEARAIPGVGPVFSAHDFMWKRLTTGYDLVVYQLGNATCHDFMWPFLFRYPGLVVLHDAQLHHARARWLLARGRGDDYQAEFHANHSVSDPNVPQVVMEDFADASYYFWPMSRLVSRSARLVAVHTPRLAESLMAQYGVDVVSIRMGVADPRFAAVPADVADPVEADRQRARALRRRLGVAEDAVVLAAFGLITPEKRLSVAVSVLGDVIRAEPRTRLVLVGGETEHYDIRAEARRLGLEDHLLITGYVPEDELPVYLGMADVCLCLRWPTGRETSASWLRAIAAGRPTIVSDLVHADEMAAYDPRTWTVNPAGSGPAAHDPSPSPVCVTVDILDERHSLGLAMKRLAEDAGLRARLGRAARTHWERYHTLACMADDYRRTIEYALRCPVPTDRLGSLPAHLRTDGTEQAREMLGAFGLDVDFLGRTPAMPDARHTKGEHGKTDRQ
jgi:glycosyltransferase involved in cell wall biosynthesis